MNKIYFTIAGMNYYYGTDIVKKGTKVNLVKEPDNKYDKEAIKVELKPFGKIGYVANSVRTVIGECYSAGRLYDKIGAEAEAEIAYLTGSYAIAKIKEARS